jgi:hypothetical protein
MAKVINTYDVVSYDVWGNEKDGWEVNDSHKTGMTVELTDEPTDRQVIEALKEVGYVNKYAKMAAFCFDYNNNVASDDIYVELANGKPFCELRKVIDWNAGAKVIADLEANKE